MSAATAMSSSHRRTSAPRTSVTGMDRYRKVEKNASLGSGAYGVVYKAVDTLTNKFVALKKIKLENEDQGIPASALRETTLLRSLKHTNVVKLEDIITDGGRLYLVFEFMDMDLKKYMDSVDGSLDPDLVQSYTRQLLQGLHFCHCRGVMHRDLKPQNLLVSRDGLLKIADFGLARAFAPPARPLTIEVITRWYRAPEILLGCQTYTTAVDMWSVAVIIVEMTTKRPMFPGDSEIDQLHKIFKVLGTPSSLTWPAALTMPYWRNTFPDWPPMSRAALQTRLSYLIPEGFNLVERMLSYNPPDRISAKEALHHPYIHWQNAK